MRAAGVDGIIYGCFGGGCGVCKVQILQGTVVLEKRSRTAVEANEEEDGVVLACKSFPTSDIVLQIISE